jgi:hypothetical protein
MPYFRRLVADFTLRRPVFEAGSNQMGFVVNKVVLGYEFFPVTLVSHANLYSTDCPTIVIYHLGLVQEAQQWPLYQVDSVLTHEKNKNKNFFNTV